MQKFIDLSCQQLQCLPGGRQLGDVIKSKISDVMHHGQYILGPEVYELEKKLANYVGASHCVAVSSGTDALLISLMALGIGPGDEVITTPFSFVATAETISLLGASPVYVDIDPQTYNMDPEKIPSAISSRTKAIVPVSLYGQPANFHAINIIAKKYNLPVIEDAAQSFGSRHKDRFSCNLSKIATTSFFPSKPLGGYGDSGACFTNDADLADSIRRISRHGQKKRYFHTTLGLNGRMDTIQAAILLAKLEIFDEEVKKRNAIADNYKKLLTPLGIESPYIEPGNLSVYAQYTIQVSSRREIQERLNDKGIPTAVHYPTLLCQQPAFKNCGLRCNQGCSTPLAQQAAERVLSLPMHPYLSRENQDIIVCALAESLP